MKRVKKQLGGLMGSMGKIASSGPAKKQTMRKSKSKKPKINSEIIEPDKELKFGGIQKYSQGGEKKHRNANQESNEKLFQQHLSESERANLSTAEKLKRARDRAAGNYGPYAKRKATTGKGKDVKTLLGALEKNNVKTVLGALDRVPAFSSSKSNRPTPKPSSSRPSSNSSNKPSSNKPAARKRPSNLTAAPKGKQAGPISTSRPEAKLQPSRRTVATSQKSMSKGKDFNKNKSSEKAAPQGKTYSKSASEKSMGKMTDRRVNSATSKRDERRANREDRQNNRKARRTAVRDVRQSYKR